MASAQVSVIGSGTFVRGRVHGSGDLEVAGRIEGDVTCTGEVVLEASGMLASDVSARRIVVRGAVKGDLVAEESISIEAGARVLGDVRAPRIGIAEGGLVRGYVQTGAGGAAKPRAQSASRATPVASAPAKAAAKAPPPAVAKVSSKNGRHTPSRVATLAGARRGPPPPVVPVLKKGTKAVQKKRG